jgi:lysophospholipase L1-like esterase
MGTYEEAMAKTTLADLDRTKLYEALRWAMWTLREKYVDAAFFVGLPIQRASREHVDAILEAIKKMANRYNFIIIDATNESGIIREFETSGAEGRYLKDGLHPNAAGAKKMAKLYSNVIIRNFLANA